MLQLVLAVGLVITLAFLGLGFNLFFRRGKGFPETEIGTNKRMRELGISCVKCSEMASYKKAKIVKQKPLRPAELQVIG